MRQSQAKVGVETTGHNIFEDVMLVAEALIDAPVHFLWLALA
jgi:hypothetical protein